MDQLTGKHLLILGIGRQGQALAAFACQAGAYVTVSDLRPREQVSEAIDNLAGYPIKFILGAHPNHLLDQCDLLALSGSIPLEAPIVRSAVNRGIPLTNDSREAFRRCPSPYTVGITGSAGKTTTTSLLGKICAAAGRTAWVGGNIGRPLITNVHQIDESDTFIQELSSFQLDLWTESPAIATVLNLTPNHLDRHKTMTAYTAAKTNVFRFQSTADTLVVNADDPRSFSLSDQANGRVRTFSQAVEVDDGAFVDRGQIKIRDGMCEQIALAVSDIQLRGSHNIANVLAACLLADSLDIPVDAMRTAIIGFTGVPHRLEPVRTLRNVTYINDSIATAPERALAALHSFREPLVLLAGGRDKAMDWAPWATYVAQNIKHIILFGHIADMLASQLKAAGRTTNMWSATSFEEAVQLAQQLAVPGDVVLLSPGGTSYDAFKDFEERGQRFRDLVHAI